MGLHGGDQDFARQAQVALVEGARVHARPLGQVDVLFEHAGRVGPAPAEPAGGGVEAFDDEAAALVVVGDHVLLAQVALVVAGVVDDQRPAEHAVTLRDRAGAQVVEVEGHGLAGEDAGQPADGPREAQVVVGAGRARAPAHAARDLQPGDETPADVGQHALGGAALGFDHGDHELVAVDRLAHELRGLDALAAGEALAGLGRRAVGAEGHLGERAAVAQRLGGLLARHVLDPHGDAPRRDHHLQARLGEAGGVGRAIARRPGVAQQALGGERLVDHARRLGRALALQLGEDRLAGLVGQLFDADLEQPAGGAHASSFWSRALRA